MPSSKEVSPSGNRTDVDDLYAELVRAFREKRNAGVQQDGQAEDKQLVTSPPWPVTLPVCLAPAGYSTAVVVYGAVPDNDLFSPSNAAICPVPVQKERARDSHTVVVADRCRDEVPVRPTDWIMAAELLFVTVLVFVCSTAVAG